MLRNFEIRTDRTVSREELDSGELAGEFVDSDYAYDSKESVSAFGIPSNPYLPAGMM